MKELQLGARASSTVRKYRATWLKWRMWALSKTDVPVIPAQPAYVALFITELANMARVKGLSFSTLEGAAYGIAWAHKMGGLSESPTDHPLIKMTLDSVKRSLSKPIKPKEPLPLSLIQDIVLHFSSDNALSVIRFLFILLVGYAGFLRTDEILKMKVCDVKIHADHMLVSVPERKKTTSTDKGTSYQWSDQTRLLVLYASQKRFWCDYLLVTTRICLRFDELLNLNQRSTFIRVSVSYSTIRDEFRKFLGQFVSNY